MCPSKQYSQNRLALLGHLFRHEDSLEYHATVMSAGRYRQIRGPARAGRPRLHWAESTMAQVSHRIDHLASDAAPSHSDINHSFFQLPTLQQVKPLILQPPLSLWKTSSTTDLLNPLFSEESNGRKLYINLLDKPVVETAPVQTAAEPSLRREK